MRKAPIFAPGDRVAYSAGMLRSTMDYSWVTASRRGTIVKVHEPQISKTAGHYVALIWDDRPDHQATALSCNLTKVSRLAVDATVS